MSEELSLKVLNEGLRQFKGVGFFQFDIEAERMKKAQRRAIREIVDSIRQSDMTPEAAIRLGYLS